MSMPKNLMERPFNELVKMANKETRPSVLRELSEHGNPKIRAAATGTLKLKK